MAFKLKVEDQEKKSYFDEHCSVPIELTESEYAILVELGKVYGSMGSVMREMLHYGISKPCTMQSTNVWVSALFKKRLTEAAKAQGTTVKALVREIIRTCIHDLGREPDAPRRSRKVGKSTKER